MWCFVMGARETNTPSETSLNSTRPAPSIVSHDMISTLSLIPLLGAYFRYQASCWRGGLSSTPCSGTITSHTSGFCTSEHTYFPGSFSYLKFQLSAWSIKSHDSFPSALLLNHISQLVWQVCSNLLSFYIIAPPSSDILKPELIHQYIQNSFQLHSCFIYFPPKSLYVFIKLLITMS